MAYQPSQGVDPGFPEGWVETTLDQLLLSMESGSRPKGGARGVTDGKPSIGGEHLDDEGGFRFDNIRYVPDDFHQRMARGRIQAGDILVVKDGATTGKVSLVRANFPYPEAVVNEHVFVCRPAEGVLPAFLFWYLFSREGQDRVLENFQGSAQGGINQSFAPGTAVSLAPWSEQKRIVAKIEALLESVNAARARLAIVPEILKRLYRSVLATACSGQLTSDWRATHSVSETAAGLLDRLRAEREAQWRKQKPTRRYSAPEPVAQEGLPRIPDSWAWTNFDHCAWEITVGHVGPMRSRYVEQGIPFLRSQNVRPLRFDPTGIVFIDAAFHADLRKSALEGGEILVTRSGANTGDCCVYPESYGKANCADLVVTRPLSGLIPAYGAIYVSSPEGQARIGLRETGMAQPHFNIGAMRAKAIPLPPVDEQREIVRRVDMLLAAVDGIGDHVRAAILRTELLPQAILARAFRGELVSTEAQLAAKEGREYEPASALLERVQEVRKQQKPAKRWRGDEKMTRPRGSRAARNRRPLAEVLREQGKPLTPERLFELAGFDELTVDEFYEQLRGLIQAGTVRQRRPNRKDVTLEAVGA
jgi:type I restriction enzyme S subunit